MPEIAVGRKEIRWALAWAIFIVGLTCLPYFYAWLSTPADMFYTGQIINPYDGNSYLAKMLQGGRGEWLFHLPYTSEDHAGAFIYTFYLLLGHFSVLVGLPLIWTYHLARVLGGLFLLLVTYYFVALFLDDVRERRAAYLLVGLSSGLGWLASPFLLTPDLWIPESITFYAIFTNPHFPLVMALMLLIFAHVVKGRLLWACLASLLLAIVQPFGLLTIYAVLGGYLTLRWIMDKRFPRPEIVRTIASGVVTVPIILYDFYVFTSNPALKAWAAQNLTPSPPPWDYVLGYGLILALALGGVVWSVRQRTNGFLLTWVGVNALLLYAPFSLQRRLVTGLHIPLCILAAVGLFRYVLPGRALLRNVVVALTTLTNILLLVASTGGAARHEHPLYIYRDEKEALDWLRENTAPHEVVLAWPGEDSSGPFPFPGTGLLIPAWAGNRVLYGHPFETIEAEEKRAQALTFFAGETVASVRREILERYDVDYVFCGPQERVWGADLESLPFLTIVYHNDLVTIYLKGDG
jgi:hypothetical protein